MNRLIIIGNGFDLAHGLKTSFYHFIEDYLNKAIISFYDSETHTYNDPLLEIKLTNNIKISDKDKMARLLNPFNEMDKLNNSHHVQIKFKSKFFKIIYNKVTTIKWVDIEIEYFKLLVEANNVKTNKIKHIINLNSSFKFLKDKLITYLEKQESEYNKEAINTYNEYFTEIINVKQLYKVKQNEDNLRNGVSIHNLLFLNFNYTNIIENYLPKCNVDGSSTIKYIHGNLNGDKGEPVFGFGDELDEDYKTFEKENIKELYQNIKSFDYLQNNNYHSMINFLDEDNFQVQIFGHSCGLSDRTMLNEIFEHDNCKSIKIFYYEDDKGDNDFTEKTYEISKHFTDKKMLRKVVVPFKQSKPMPQIKKD